MAYELLKDDLAADLERALAEFYGEALAPVLLKAQADLCAETALKFLHLDELLEHTEAVSSGAD